MMTAAITTAIATINHGELVTFGMPSLLLSHGRRYSKVSTDYDRYAGGFVVAGIAVLGTGLLGSGMVRRFLKNGARVTVWNRCIDKARALEKDGAVATGSPADAVKDADHVH